jgi:ferredoxin-fold anticodon binding domain-containing protein
MVALSVSAQFRYRHTTYEQQQEQRKQAIRDAINFDYSVPDYNVSRPDEKVMGWRLAKMLLFLENNYAQWQHNRRLSMIRNVQMGEVGAKYDPIDKIKVLNVQKQDSVITIKINTFSKGEKKRDDVYFDITLSFTNNMSDDETANTLFSDIGHYIRKNEE